MAGDTTKAAIWPEADVYVAFDLDTTDPADVDTDFGVDWDLIGLLDGEQGFAHSRSEDVTDHFAWGGIVVRTARKNFKETVTFTALEDNDTTRALVWPGSSGGELIVPRPESVRVAFETREGDTIRRLISKNRAEISVNADIVDKEDDLTRYQFLATIFPDANGVLFTEQKTEASS